MPPTNRWIPQVFGDPNGKAWEISVVREQNTHGRLSWGWFGRDKLLISFASGQGQWPLAPGLGDQLVQIAKGYAAKLNAAEELEVVK